LHPDRRPDNPRRTSGAVESRQRPGEGNHTDAPSSGTLDGGRACGRRGARREDVVDEKDRRFGRWDGGVPVEGRTNVDQARGTTQLGLSAAAPPAAQSGRQQVPARQRPDPGGEKLSLVETSPAKGPRIQGDGREHRYACRGIRTCQPHDPAGGFDHPLRESRSERSPAPILQSRDQHVRRGGVQHDRRSGVQGLRPRVAEPAAIAIVNRRGGCTTTAAPRVRYEGQEALAHPAKGRTDRDRRSADRAGGRQEAVEEVGRGQPPSSRRRASRGRPHLASDRLSGGNHRQRPERRLAHLV